MVLLMKKTLFISALFFMFFTHSFSEERIEVKSKLGINYSVSSKLLPGALDIEQYKKVSKQALSKNAYKEIEQVLKQTKTDENMDMAMPLNGDDALFSITKSTFDQNILINNKNINEFCNEVLASHIKIFPKFKTTECKVSDIFKKGTGTLWISNTIDNGQSRMFVLHNFIKNIRYEIMLGCGVNYCDNYKEELFEIAKSLDLSS